MASATALVKVKRLPKKQPPRVREKLDRKLWPKIRKKLDGLLARAVSTTSEEEARSSAIAFARILDRYDLHVVHPEVADIPEVDPILAPAKPGETWASRAGFGELCGFAIIWQDEYDRFHFGYVIGQNHKPMVYMNPHDAFRVIEQLKVDRQTRMAYGVVPIHKL